MTPHWLASTNCYKVASPEIICAQATIVESEDCIYLFMRRYTLVYIFIHIYISVKIKEKEIITLRRREPWEAFGGRNGRRKLYNCILIFNKKIILKYQIEVLYHDCLSNFI